MVGRIKKEDIEKVRSAADLYDIVSDSVALKASGSGTYMGLCPFHDEKTPSFSVRPALGAWHCFGCGLGGDTFAYVEESESVGFGEAVEILADKYGIELHYDDSPKGNDRKGSTRSRLLQANEEAQKFFASQIGTKEALPARKLLGGRTFTKAQAEHFGCGYAPRGWDNLVRFLSNKGFTHQEMVDAGLARQGQRGIYDYFRGRVTWPIRDSTGRAIGFGARKLYEDDTIQAKYINTPDTVLYHKNQVLYGIDLAKKDILRHRQAVIVEGYTDVMACHLAGITTAVATCGTAFGLEHAKIIRRLISDDSLGAVQLVGPTHGSRVVFTFDGDAAGKKAAMHAFGLDGSFLTQTFVAVAKNGLDPCDLRIQHGDTALKELVANAEPLYDFVIDTVIDAFDKQYTTGQVGAMKAVAPLIAQIRDRSLLDLYTRKAARRIGIDLGMIQQQVAYDRRRAHVKDEDAYVSRSNRQNFATQLQRNEDAMPGAMSRRRLVVQRQDAQRQRYFAVDDSLFMCEQQLMGVIVQIPGAIAPSDFDQLSAHSFAIPVFRDLFSAIMVAGGLPDLAKPAGQWLHDLNKAAGPLLEPVISELSVMPLPLSGAGVKDDKTSFSSRVGASGSSGGENEKSQRLQYDQNITAQTPAARQYAFELVSKIRDAAVRRQIEHLRYQMKTESDTTQKKEMFKKLADLESLRRQISTQLFDITHNSK